MFHQLMHGSSGAGGGEGEAMQCSTSSCMAAVEGRGYTCAWQQDGGCRRLRWWELRDGRRHSSLSAHGLAQKIYQTPVPHLSHTSPTPTWRDL